MSPRSYEISLKRRVKRSRGEVEIEKKRKARRICSRAFSVILA
jgi:hypothetical protein